MLSLTYAVLGLLTYKSMSGYDLKLFFDATIKNIWPAQISQIYRVLANLEEMGYAVSHIELQETRPARRVYKITDEGRHELSTWLNKIPQNFVSIIRDETALRMFFGSKIETDELIFQLKMLLKEKKETFLILDLILEKIKESSFEPEKLYWLLSLRKGYLLAQAEIHWVKECIHQLEKIQ